jgi:hypothetical protein
MPRTERFAIYLAPPPDTPLWCFGSEVLGYDAATGEDKTMPAIANLSPDCWRLATERPRTYGFHGTLKAPFRLAVGYSEGSLREALRLAAARRTGFDAGPLAVTSLDQGGEGFVALTLQRTSAALSRLEKEIVEELDHFRAPPTETEIGARRPERLTQQQRENLTRWGYPYVGADYKFHMTLSGMLERPAEVADALARMYMERVGSAHLVVDALVLFAQKEPGARFKIIDRAPLALQRDTGTVR